MDLEAEVLKYEWYHTIDLGNGIRTPGRSTSYGHIPVVKLLSEIDVTGADCLDIGTMDGLIAFLLEKKKANKVYATCLNDRSSFRFLKKFFNSDIFYYPKISLDTLDTIKKSGINKFDLIVFSGVLYHLIDPMRGLAIVRNFLKNGGLAIIETAITNFKGSKNDEICMYINHDGRFLPGFENVFIPTKNCLRYMLSYCCFNTLREEIIFDGPTPRCAVIARAVSPTNLETSDYWLKMVHHIGGGYAPLRPLYYEHSQEAENKIDICDQLAKIRATFPEKPSDTKSLTRDQMKNTFRMMSILKKLPKMGIKETMIYHPFNERFLFGALIPRVFKLKINLTGFVTNIDQNLNQIYGIPTITLKNALSSSQFIACLSEHHDYLRYAGILKNRLITD